MPSLTKYAYVFGLSSALLLLPACSSKEPTPPPPLSTTVVVTQAVIATPTPMPTLPPTATPIPLAATINGEPIYLERYEQELAVYTNWYPDGKTPTGEDVRVHTLNVLIQQALIDQFAVQNGVVVSADDVSAQIADSITRSGGDEAFRVWLSTSGYPDEAYFRQQVQNELVSQAVIELVTKDVPTGEPAVRARYLQVDDGALAADLHTQLQNGADFAHLIMAHSLDPYKETTQGDLDYFQRGMLTVPAIEEAAFALEVNQFSDVLTVTRSDGSLTYYIVQVLQREENRPYSADLRAQKLAARFEQWLAEQKANAQLDVMIGFD